LTILSRILTPQCNPSQPRASQGLFLQDDTYESLSEMQFLRKSKSTQWILSNKPTNCS
jgi:hypothetical protein